MEHRLFGWMKRPATGPIGEAPGRRRPWPDDLARTVARAEQRSAALPNA